MKLKRYNVFNFRSILESGWIDCDDVTTLVGVNESGKSNLLLALWKLNPVRNGDIDILHDMPVDRLSELRYKIDEVKFVTAEFELNDDEFSKIEDIYIIEKQKQNILEVSRYYDGEYLLRLNNIPIDEFELKENKQEETDDNSQKGNKLSNLAMKMMPKFVYYSNYGNLTSKIYLPHAVTWLEGKQVTGIPRNEEQIRTLRILFDYVNLSPEEILTLGRDAIDIANEGLSNRNKTPEKTHIEEAEKAKEERSILLQSASTNLTKQFKEWWKQGEYKFRFEADGDYFTILVSDEKRPAEVDLGLRSTGLQWFLSFYLTFLVESEESHENAILLLDEAGLTLHPLAQKDLVRFFNSLSEKNQIINTTHSPFIVDTDNMDRCKVVYSTKNGLTEVSNDLRKNDKTNSASIYAVHAALGLSVSDVLLQGCQVIIVEGTSDQHYLNAIKNYLISKNKINPNKELVFVPSGGVKNISSISSILGGKNNNLPYVIVDSDQSGIDLKAKLINNLYKGNDNKILEIKDYTDMENSEMEDLVSYEVLEKPLIRMLRDCDDDFEYNENQPLVNQLTDFAKQNEIDLGKGWKVELSKSVKVALQKPKIHIHDDTIEKWIKLFNEFLK